MELRLPGVHPRCSPSRRPLQCRRPQSLKLRWASTCIAGGSGCSFPSWRLPMRSTSWIQFCSRKAMSLERVWACRRLVPLPRSEPPAVCIPRSCPCQTPHPGHLQPAGRCYRFPSNIKPGLTRGTSARTRKAAWPFLGRLAGGLLACRAQEAARGAAQRSASCRRLAASARLHSLSSQWMRAGRCLVLCWIQMLPETVRLVRGPSALRMRSC